MKRMRFYSDDVYRGNLILVNQEHPISENYLYEKFLPIGGFLSQIFVAEQAASVLDKIFSLLDCNSQIVPVSGFRSKEEQEKIYDDSLKKNGEAFTQSYVASPGCSEHQTGLAIDLAKNENEIDFIRPEFPYEGICQVFREKAVRYGFVERYPRGKEGITGIAREPWHFRYVGYPHSEIMKKEGFVLEEYIEYVRQFPYGEKSLHPDLCGGMVKISYVDMKGKGDIELELPDKLLYQVSGDNKAGLILTIWSEFL